MRSISFSHAPRRNTHTQTSNLVLWTLYCSRALASLVRVLCRRICAFRVQCTTYIDVVRCWLPYRITTKEHKHRINRMLPRKRRGSIFFRKRSLNLFCLNQRSRKESAPLASSTGTGVCVLCVCLSILTCRPPLQSYAFII